jgi:hypothetical protein
MASLQVKNVPADLHRKLRRMARQRSVSIRDLVLEAVRREMDREEFRARLARRAPVELGGGASVLLEEARGERGLE